LSTQYTPLPENHGKNGKTKKQKAINIQNNKSQSPNEDKKKYKN